MRFFCLKRAQEFANGNAFFQGCPHRLLSKEPSNFCYGTRPAAHLSVFVALFLVRLISGVLFIVFFLTVNGQESNETPSRASALFAVPRSRILYSGQHNFTRIDDGSVSFPSLGSKSERTALLLSHKFSSQPIEIWLSLISTQRQRRSENSN
jgi:hypothetical protein